MKIRWFFEGDSGVKYGILLATQTHTQELLVRKVPGWLLLSRQIHLKIQIGESIETPAHFIVNAGSPAMM